MLYNLVSVILNSNRVQINNQRKGALTDHQKQANKMMKYFSNKFTKLNIIVNSIKTTV